MEEKVAKMKSNWLDAFVYNELNEQEEQDEEDTEDENDGDE